MQDPGKEARAAAGLPVVAALDGFRAYAILAVVLSHVILYSGAAATLTGLPRDFASAFPLGVDALFVISGFVVFMPTVARGGEFGSVLNYAIRRGARLAPAYWLVLLIIFLLLAVAPPATGLFGAAEALTVPPPGDFLAHTVFIQTPLQLLNSDFAGGLKIDGPLWTLSVEVAFYAVLPLVAKVYYRRPLLGLAIAALISLTWHLVFGNVSDVASVFGWEPDQTRLAEAALASDYQLPAWAFSFGAGMTAAWAYVELKASSDGEEIQRRATLIQPVALALVLILIYVIAKEGFDNALESGFAAANTAGVGRREPLLGLAFSASITALMLSTAFAGPRVQWAFSNRVIREVGDISYGVYLIHFPVLVYMLDRLNLSRDGSFVTFLEWGAIALAISLAYGYLSARFLEIPIRRWARRYGRRGQSGEGTESAAAVPRSAT